MFIVRNAMRNVTRNKGRNILMIIIVAIITAAATIGLAIVQAAQHARTSALANTQITAQITQDRNAIMQQARANANSSDRESGMKALRDAMNTQLTLADYEKYDKSDYGVASSYYTMTASTAATTNGIEPVSSTESSSDATTNSSQNDSSKTSESSDQPNRSDAPDGAQGGGDKGGMMMTTGDFSLVGFSSDEALQNAQNGAFTMESGQAFGYDSDDVNQVIISQTLAQANNVKVGDTITLANVANSKTTYKFKVVGIYTNTTDSSMPQGGPMMSNASDPDNAIYTSVATLEKNGLTPDKSMEITDSRGNTRTTAVAQLNYTYVFDGKANYDKFVTDVKELGLSSNYTVQSADVEQYEASLVPINNVANFARTLLIIVLVVGAVILVVLTIFNIRERKYEIGVLTAIGIRKSKVAAQFAIELLIVTILGLAVGTGIGAATSVPVSDHLLASQVEAQQTQREQERSQFGRDMQGPPERTSQDSNSQNTDEQSNNDKSQQKDKQNMPPQDSQNRGRFGTMVSQLNATVNWATLGWMLLIGIGLTLIAALVAAIFVMRYEPLQILADRS